MYSNRWNECILNIMHFTILKCTHCAYMTIILYRK